MSVAWSGRSQANSLGFIIFIWVIRHLGLHLAYALLKVVAVYYLFFSKQSNEALKEYFERIRVKNPRDIRHRYRTFVLFGQSLIDKIAVYTNTAQKLKFDFENEHYLHELAARKQGALLLGAHLGNWEIAGQLLRRIDTDIYIVMLENEHERIKKILDGVSRQKSFQVIPVTEDISFVVKIKEVLDNGGFVCMHADRFLEGMRTLSHEFLGHNADFPYGTFFMGSRLKTPVTFVYGLKDALFHYQFSCTRPLVTTSPEDLLTDFVKVMETKAKDYPHQWYNFYPFWK